MTATKPEVTRVLNLGTRLSPAKKPEGRVVIVFDKFARRIERGRAIRHASSVDKRLAACRRADLEASRLASNSHEAKRFVEADRRERGGK